MVINQATQRPQGRSIKLLSSVSAIIFAFALSTPVAVGQTNPNKCVAQHYTLIALPLRPVAINDAGTIVGTTDSHRAALWTKSGGLKEIGVPPGYDSSEGVGLNAAGHVIAVAINLKTNQRQGFTYVNGVVKLMSGNHARPFAINDADEIAGEVTVASGASVPVIWKGPDTVELGGCCGGAASGVNNHSQAIGNIYDQQGHYQAFLWEKKPGMRNIGPPDSFSSALAINDQGHVLVESFRQGVQLYVDGKLARLALSTKLPYHPRSLNNCDVVVGAVGAFTDSGHAIVWEQSAGLRDLNDLVAPHSTLELREANAINNQGQIVGWGEYRRDDEAGFLLTVQP